MNNINFGRVLLGGLLAGLVLNVGEYLLNGVVLGTQMKAFFGRHNFQDPGGNFIAIAITMTFILGIVLVLIYAMIRPRFGPGSEGGNHRWSDSLVRHIRLHRNHQRRVSRRSGQPASNRDPLGVG